jgi:hypothetical protein
VECRNGKTRTISKTCGFKDRGRIQQICQNNTWTKQQCKGVWYASCLQIHKARPKAKSGQYSIDPDGPSNNAFGSFKVTCDMSTDGGGWTVVTRCLAQNKLRGRLKAVDSAPNAGVDDKCRPWTRDGNGDHVYHYTFDFPAGFEEARFDDYHARANSPKGDVSELDPPAKQTSWTGSTRDISFGTAAQSGPIDSYARHVSTNCTQHGHPNYCCQSCEIAWQWTNPLSFGQTRKTFRIGWGESGGQSEGWYPWWKGTIKLR